MGVRENPNYAHLHLLSQEHGGGEGPDRHQRPGILLREVEVHSGAWPGRAGGRGCARLLLGILFLQGAAGVDTCVCVLDSFARKEGAASMCVFLRAMRMRDAISNPSSIALDSGFTYTRVSVE